MKIKDLLKNIKKPYNGLTHFPKGSALEGLRIPTEDDARKSAKNLIKNFKRN
jgi:hypothetical protein